MNTETKGKAIADLIQVGVQITVIRAKMVEVDGELEAILKEITEALQVFDVEHPLDQVLGLKGNAEAKGREG